MKFIALLLSTFVLFTTATCSNTPAYSEGMEVTGTIQKLQMTSYQYGTHSIENDTDFYALKSEAVNLDKYVGQEVTIVAEKIEGYPIEGGPEYLLVLKVK